MSLRRRTGTPRRASAPPPENSVSNGMKTLGEGKDTREIPLVASLLDSAPSRLPGMTVDKPFSPSPNRRDFSYRDNFGGVNILNPFHRASEAARNLWPGYSWPPRLYQEHYESMCALRPSQEMLRSRPLILTRRPAAPACDPAPRPLPSLARAPGNPRTAP